MVRGGGGSELSTGSGGGVEKLRVIHNWALWGFPTVHAATTIKGMSNTLTLSPRQLARFARSLQDCSYRVSGLATILARSADSSSQALPESQCGPQLAASTRQWSSHLAGLSQGVDGLAQATDELLRASISGDEELAQRLGGI